MTQKQRDHGGGLDAAVAEFGGVKSDWLDLSTGINPTPYPLPDLPADAWQVLPDSKRQNALLDAAATFWNAPKGSAVLASSGVSQLIAAIPHLLPASSVYIPSPTYNEHAAAFQAARWNSAKDADVLVVVHPNNPDGLLHKLTPAQTARYKLVIIDESFCDTCPEQSLIALANQPNVIILKGVGKFWGLAGLRLGFAIGDPKLIQRLRDLTGPWAVSGPAQIIGATALLDQNWASAMRAQLIKDAARMDEMASDAGLQARGGTSLFRLYQTDDAKSLQKSLASHRIWSRVFPYSDTWIRLGLPSTSEHWTQLGAGLKG